MHGAVHAAPCIFVRKQRNNMDKHTTHKTPSYNRQLDARVGRLEGAVESLAREVEETSRNMRGIIEAMGKVREDLSTQISQASAPKWPLITASIAVGTTILTLTAAILAVVFSGLSSNIHDNTAVIQRLQDQVNVSRFDDGGLHKSVEILEKRFQDLETKMEQGP